MLFIPLFSLFVAISLGKPENARLSKTALLLLSIPTVLCLLLVLTNDLHQLVFSFPEGEVYRNLRLQRWFCCNGTVYRSRSEGYQRSDGKYEYKYADSNGERHSVYSWKLVATDKVPEGKQGGTSLRDMEKQIQKDLEDNLLIYQTRKMTLNSFWDQYIELKKELKESTRTNYIYMYDNYVRPDFGKRTSLQ